MRSTLFYRYFAPAALFLFALTVVGHSESRVDAHNINPSPAQQQGDPSASLSRGRTLLKQGHADQAIGYLENALTLYTQANNQRGVAASEDALGDLYLVQG